MSIPTPGESPLNPEVGEILEGCRDAGVRAVVSTNLSLQDRLVRVLVEGEVELLLVSVSGLT